MNGLLDFLQGASNAAASNISGPVDLIGMGLRKLGVPVPQNALLSSQWMEERGLTRKPKNALAAMAGETVGLLSPVVAAAKAPQIARGLLDTADDFQRYNQALGPAGVSQAVAWHGSPHKFDKFKTVSESANSMGMLGNVPTVRHGAFLSDNPKFAAEYGNVSKWDVKPKKTAKITADLKDEFVNSLDPFGPERDLWLQAKYGANNSWGLFEGDLGKRFTEWLKSKGYDSAKFKEYIPTSVGKEVGGNTTVILNPDIARLLDDAGLR